MYTKASSFVAYMKKKYNINSVWVWDLLEEEYNIIKGIGCLLNKEEKEKFEKIIKENIK